MSGDDFGQLNHDSIEFFVFLYIPLFMLYFKKLILVKKNIIRDEGSVSTLIDYVCFGSVSIFTFYYLFSIKPF